MTDGLHAPQVEAQEALSPLTQIKPHSLFEELKWRGMLYDATPELEETIGKESMTAYIGFDPTAASLHVGSLLPVMGLDRLQRFGHTPIALVGGGTGLIGDPSGKTAERQLLDSEQVSANLEGIRGQLAAFLDFESGSNRALMVNNLDWLGSVGLIEFLRDIGKHFTVNYMLAKESVKRRVESEDGISYTEFTYMMLQAYDFFVLNERHDCTLQMGGSDQWGNIVAGADLVRRMNGNRVHGMVFPLVTNSAGTKFGKTESGTVWLDPTLTSPYRFFQFWLNTDDRDVGQYLRFFTWLERSEIEALDEAVAERPGSREAQKKLADEVTSLVHGPSELDKARAASSVLFGGVVENLTGIEIREIFEDVPSANLPKSAFDGEGINIVDLLADSGLASSKGEARRLVQSGGAYVNNIRVPDGQTSVGMNECIDGHLLVLRKGRKNYLLVQVLD